MSAIHIAEPGGRQTIYTEEQARVLWDQHGVSSQALYWMEGMPEWRPATEYFMGSLPPGAQPNAHAWWQKPRGFVKDPTMLTRYLKVMLCVWIVLCALSIPLSIASILAGPGSVIAAGEDEVGFGLLAIVNILDSLLTIVEFFALFMACIPFFVWVHRSNLNARGLGAKGMNFTPAWAVGWFFIPVMNLAKPFQAMKEIWQASHNPPSWSPQDPTGPVNAWWTVWLCSILLGVVLIFSGDLSPTTDKIVSIFDNLIDIVLCLLAFRMVTRIYTAQKAWSERVA